MKTQPTPSAHTSAPLAQALRLAAQVIFAVREGRSLDAAFDALQLNGPLRSATRDLACGALRRFGRDSFYLERLIPRPLDQPLIHSLLLAALYRLHERPQDAHTTVDQAVQAAALMQRGKFQALVNAVLRNFLRRQTALEHLAAADAVAQHQHPGWWLQQLQADWPDAWENIAATGNARGPMGLRVNRRHLDAATYVRQLAEHGIAGQALSETAVLLAKPAGVDSLPGFAQGRVSVQDVGAQAAARLLDARPGMRVLDACAAPGGKTGHLLECADIDLLALEIDAARAQRIEENLARLQLRATIKVADCRKPQTWWDGLAFERILVDAPCSGSGVVRRHPDAKWLRRKEDLVRLAASQDSILEALWTTLAPGGVLLYATCSVFAQENEARIKTFCARHKDARPGPVVQLMPGPQHDGFFYAPLEKNT